MTQYEIEPYDNIITIFSLNRETHRAYQTNKNPRDIERSEILKARKAMVALPAILDVDTEFGDNVISVSVDDPELWTEADLTVLPQLISAVGWGGQDVAVYDRTIDEESGERVTVLREVGVVNTSNGVIQYTVKAPAA